MNAFGRRFVLPFLPLSFRPIRLRPSRRAELDFFRRSRGPTSDRFDWEPQREARAGPRPTRHVDIAAEQTCQLSRNGQPEPGSAHDRIASPTGPHLFELVEDP